MNRKMKQIIPIYIEKVQDFSKDFHPFYVKITC